MSLAKKTRAYHQHESRDTTLYRFVEGHLDSFLRESREHYDTGLPAYVEREFREYLKCGILAFGFLRVRCRACEREMRVAFSCKKRGACPSCCARRMCGTAAYLVDFVLPQVPVRQWVLSVPFELRILLARNPEALSAVGRILVQEIFRYQCQRGRSIGLCKPRAGAINFPQRFGGSLNLNVHYHVVVPDGVFTVQEGAMQAEFHVLPRPTAVDIETVVLNVEMRVMAWLRRKGLLHQEKDIDDPSSEVQERTALDACLQGSLGIGELTTLRATQETSDPEEGLPRPTKSARRHRKTRGFDLNAGVLIGENDRQGRERLLRYCARPPLSLERIRILPDGRVAYALRKVWGKQTHRVMQPVQFLARLAALIPPPRHPMIRFHGVFASHSAWRKRVVALARPNLSEVDPKRGACTREIVSQGTQSEGKAANARGKSDNSAVFDPVGQPEAGKRGESGRLPHADFSTLGASYSRIDWAELLKRVYKVDALACPCGGRLRFIALITDTTEARTILNSVTARARSP